MMCRYREDKGKCTWWIAGCVNSCVSAEIKQACSGQIPRYKTQDIRINSCSCRSPVTASALGTKETDVGRYSRGKKE